MVKLKTLLCELKIEKKPQAPITKQMINEIAIEK